MTTPSLDVARAVARQEQVRSDPTGWPSLDLANLLDLWRFELEQIEAPGAGWRVPVWSHPSDRTLNVTLWPSDRVHVGTALHIVRIIDTLRGRMGV